MASRCKIEPLVLTHSTFKDKKRDGVSFRASVTFDSFFSSISATAATSSLHAHASVSLLVSPCMSKGHFPKKLHNGRWHLLLPPRQKKEMLPKVHARTKGRRGEIIKVFTASISSQGDAKASAISRPFHPWTCVHRIKLKRQSSSSQHFMAEPSSFHFLLLLRRATLSTLRRLVCSCWWPRRRRRCWSCQHRNKKKAPLEKFTPSQRTKNRSLNIAPPSSTPPVRSPARVGLTGEYGTKDRGGEVETGPSSRLVASIVVARRTGHEKKRISGCRQRRGQKRERSTTMS